MPVKKMRKIGGMPWWYIRKKIIFPIVVLSALVVVSIVMFSLFKSKRLSYIPRASEEKCYAGESNYVSVGEQNSGYICCRTGSNGINWPHFEEGTQCADGGQSTTQSSKEPEPPTTNTDTTDTVDNNTVVDNSEPTNVPEQKPIQTNNENISTSSKRILILGDSEVASSFVPKDIGDSVKRVCTDCDFVGSRKDITSTYRMEGFPGYTTTRFVRDELNAVISNLSSTPPDVVVLHFGTNDVTADGGAYFASNMASILNSFRGLNPNTQFVIAQIPLIAKQVNGEKVVDRTYAYTIQEVINKTIRNLGEKYAADPGVTAEDYGTLSNGAFDGVHPGYSGQFKMAAALSGVLIPLIRE